MADDALVAGAAAAGAAGGERVFVDTLGGKAKTPTSKGNWWIVSFPTILVATAVCIIFVLGKDYIKGLLMFVESMDPVASSSVFLVLFTSVSFPVFWGYVLLNLAVGYLYGVLRGTMLTSLCALSGVAVAHLTIRRYIRNFVMRIFETNEQFNALMVVFSGKQAYRLVFFTRLTPLPFGLQNSIFAVSKISTVRYLAASFVGLLPTQALFTYMGSTLRSMEEVFSDGNSATGWIIFSVQIMFSVGLTVFIVRKAKTELNNAVNEQNLDFREVEDRVQKYRAGVQAAESSSSLPYDEDKRGRGPDIESDAFTKSDRSVANVHYFRTFA